MKNLLSEKIRAVRRELNLTQENVAKELKVSYQQYQKYEKGEKEINGLLLKKIADAMNVSEEYIINKELIGVHIINNNCTGNVGFYGDNNNDINEVIKVVKEMNESNLNYLEKLIVLLLKDKK